MKIVTSMVRNINQFKGKNNLVLLNTFFPEVNPRPFNNVIQLIGFNIKFSCSNNRII